MKVLCFHPALAPYRVDFFNLLAERVDLEVVLLMENLKNQKLDQTALKAQAKFKWRMLTRGFEIRGRLFRFGLRKIIRETNPDVILSCEASPITAFLCLLRKFSKWCLWTHMDEAAVTILSRRGIRAWVRNFVLRHCDGVIVPSKESAAAYRQVLSDCGAPGVRSLPRPAFASVPIIHDTKAIRAHAEQVIGTGKTWRATLPSTWQKVLLFVGRLAPVKNLAWLIEQLPNLPEDVGLVIVGDGSEREKLESLVAQHHLEMRVRFDGKHEGDAVYARMSAADALVLPSTFEPYGAVVGEALQWGMPCVVSDKVGARMLISDVNGVIYPSNDSSVFATALTKAFACKVGTDSMLSVELHDAVENYLFKLQT